MTGDAPESPSARMAQVLRRIDPRRPGAATGGAPGELERLRDRLRAQQATLRRLRQRVRDLRVRADAVDRRQDRHAARIDELEARVAELESEREPRENRTDSPPASQPASARPSFAMPAQPDVQVGAALSRLRSSIASSARRED